MALVDFARSSDHAAVCEAYVFPEFCVVDEVALLLPYPPQELVETCAVVKLVEQVDEEVNISGRVDKVSSWSLVFGSPDLDTHGLGEYLLRKLVLCRDSSWGIILVVVHYTGSLQINFSQLFLKRQVKISELTLMAIRWCQLDLSACLKFLSTSRIYGFHPALSSGALTFRAQGVAGRVLLPSAG